MRGPRLFILLLAVAVLAMGGLLIAQQRAARSAGGHAAEQGPLTVFAPCGLNGPIQVAVTLFRRQQPDTKISYDNANILVRRVVQDGERPDVFISPGELELSQVAKAGLMDQASVVDFGSLDMVLIAPAKDTTVSRIEDLTSPKVTAVALGDPKFNSIGLYGQQILTQRNLWAAVQPKLMLREFPLEAFHLVSEGKVQAGLAYLTCPLDTNPEKASASDVRIVQKFARDSYGPIRLQAGRLKGCPRPHKAQAFLDFLTSPQAQQLMAKDGVLPVEELKK